MLSRASKQQQVRALIVSSDPFFFIERVKLVVLMARDALPTIFADREQAEAGGLISTAPVAPTPIDKRPSTSAGSSRVRSRPSCL